MKLYTLDYNCNQPLTQQVNIATNTDAKIGIKVQKDGEYLNLDGSTLSIELPEVITPEPTDVKGESRHIQTQLETFITLVCPLSAVVGDDVKATSINFEKSADDSTWLSAAVTGTINYIDTAISGNSALAQCDVSQGQTQWTWIRTPLAGQKTDTVPATATSRLQWAGLDTNLALGYWRVNCEAQGKSYHATISADAEPTNGYVTFPISTPDTASLVQDTVVVNKPHAFNGTIKKTGQYPAQADPTHINPSVLQVSAKELDAVGAVVNANDIGPKQIKQWRNANPVPTELSAWNTTTWLNQIDEGVYGVMCVIVEGYIDEYGDLHGKEVYCKQKTGDPTKFVFADRLPVWPPAYTNERETYTLTENSRFVRQLNFKANWYYGQAIDLVLDGTPTKATFKLNLNTFKSQQGDKDYIGELPYIPSETINIAGTYTDNTPFSYDVFINEQ